jgi:hypothetical protein
LEQAAARQTLIDIAEDHHNPEEVDRVLSLTDNMPLAINLIAHLVDVEGCSSVLSRWEEEKTSLISDGYDKRSNLDLSISMSLSSPRIQAVPHSKELLSLLAILPDGLSDLELVQSKLQIDDVLDCKTALIRTALAYRDEKKRLKALVPIREYMKKTYQPGHDLIRPLLKYFKELLELYKEFNASQMSSSVAQILSNSVNIQNILQNGLQPNHPDLKDTMFCVLDLNVFSRVMGRGPLSFLEQLHHVLPDPCDHWLEAALITELFASSYLSPILNPEALVAQASEHFEHFDDPDLECRLSADAWCMKTDINLQVGSTTMLHTIIQPTAPLFLKPWIFVTWPYPWQIHLETQKDIPKQYFSLHGFTGSLATTWQPDYMHVRHRGWPEFLLIYTMKRGHST